MYITSRLDEPVSKINMKFKRKPSRIIKGEFEKIDAIIKKKFEKKGPVYSRHEFQEYGIWLSEELHDYRHKSLYIKLSKEKPRAMLEEAKGFAKDYKTESVNRGKLFMWKLGELEKEKKTHRAKSD